MAKNDRTEAAVALSSLLTSAAMEALRRYADLRAKWRDVYTGLVRLSQTGGGLMRYQPDHLIDLIVRSMEDELAARHRAAPEGDGRVHLEDTLQYVLTRYWVLGTHDVLRIAARSPAGKVHPKLPSLYERFRLVRVPLAKLKIAGDDALKDGRVMLVHEEDEAKPEAYRARSNDEYHPPTPIDERGSIGWHLFDVKTMLPVTIYRRQLSDELLALFD